MRSHLCGIFEDFCPISMPTEQLPVILGNKNER